MIPLDGAGSRIAPFAKSAKDEASTSHKRLESIEGRVIESAEETKR